MQYFLIIAGILTMCVPEDASPTRFIVQAGVGLIMFGLGVFIAIESSEK